MIRALVLAALTLPLSAHVGSPDVFFEGPAGPYHLLVTIRPPQVAAAVPALQFRVKAIDPAQLTHAARVGQIGNKEVALGVHTENPNGAYELYSSLGYEVVKTWTTYRKPL